MITSPADIERAARALTVAEGFTSSDAVVLVGLKSVPVWTTRVERVVAVIEALASCGRNAKRQDPQGLGPKDEHAVGSEAGETPIPSSDSTPGAQT